MSTQILKGLRVLDLSRMLSGPYCTMHLADHGAEVIKIESGEGDTSRGNGPFCDDDPEHMWAGYFVSLNRGKKSVKLDLKSPEGAAQFRALAVTADVIVENFRPRVMERLGLSYESLAAENPKLVYAAIRGFGDPRTGESPYANWPSSDVVAQAMAMGGLMSITGPDANTPTKTGLGVGEIFAGMMMAFGIMAALREAESTGKGQFVDVAIYDAMISLCERMVYLHDVTGEASGPEGNGHPFPTPFGLYPAEDGHVALGIVDDAFWQRLTAIMGRPELGNDARFVSRQKRAENAADVDRIVSDWTNCHSKRDLAYLLGGKVPFGPLNTIDEIVNDPHVAARGMLASVPVPSGAPWTVAANPLRFGAHKQGPYAAPPTLGADNAVLGDVSAAPAVDPDTKRSLRDAFGRFATGVTVVTTRQNDGTPRGFTANSFTSVSLDPPLLLVCIGKSAHSCETFSGAPNFCVNILSDSQKNVSGLFASQSTDKFAVADWHSNADNMPVIDGALASFSCSRHRLVDAGDHLILIGRVQSFETSDGNPLGYYRGAYFDFGVDQALTDAAVAAGGSLAAVLADGSKLLLANEKTGAITVPTTPRASVSTDAFIDFFKTLGLSVELAHPYAVYQTSDASTQRIIYLGSVDGAAPEGMAYFDLDDLPLDRIADEAERSMLQRYVQETRHGHFGLYHGTDVEGVVHTLSGHHNYRI